MQGGDVALDPLCGGRQHRQDLPDAYVLAATAAVRGDIHGRDPVPGVMLDSAFVRALNDPEPEPLLINRCSARW
jgi:hypothetical protein